MSYKEDEMKCSPTHNGCTRKKCKNQKINNFNYNTFTSV